MRTFRTAFLLTALTVVLLFLGKAFAGTTGMTIALGFAILMNGFAYFYSDKIALKTSGARPVTREQAQRLYEVMERLCGKANLPMPKLYMIPSQAPNAFATGRNPSHASVAVTQGLMEIMSDDEMEGVIAHELSHVKNYDILTSSIAATIAGAIIWIAEIGKWGMIFGGFGGRDNEGMGELVGTLALLIIAPLAATMLQLGISRQREFQADASGARMVGHPYGLISALKKLEAYNKRIPMNVSPTTSSLFIVAPLAARRSMMTTMANLFSTHPPLQKRIDTLQNMTIIPGR
jgi:heat shock protein HtpX